MPREDLNREIDALRRQVAELQSQLQEDKVPPAAGESKEQKVEEEVNPQEQFPDLGGLQQHLEDLFESLEHELKEIPAITAVALFGLGILFGRFLSK